MAQIDALKNALSAQPIYELPFAIVFPIVDADGGPVSSATGLDSEVSINGDSFADCTNEATEIGSGVYCLALTAAEMTASVVAVQVKTSTVGAKTRVITLFPLMPVVVSSGTAQGGSSTYLTLSSLSTQTEFGFSNFFAGCVCSIESGTGSGQCRIITSYDGGTKRATVTPNWATSPDATSVYRILYIGRDVRSVNGKAWVTEWGTGGSVEASDDGSRPIVAVESFVDSGIRSIYNQPRADVNTAGSVGEAINSIYSRTSGGRVEVTSAVAEDGTITLVQGDDYPSGQLVLNAAWTGESIAGATASLIVQPTEDYEAETTENVSTIGTLTIGAASGGVYPITIVLTDTETSALTGDISRRALNYIYQVKATVGSNTHTVALGSMTVRRKIA